MRIFSRHFQRNKKCYYYLEISSGKFLISIKIFSLQYKIFMISVNSKSLLGCGMGDIDMQRYRAIFFSTPPPSSPPSRAGIAFLTFFHNNLWKLNISDQEIPSIYFLFQNRQSCRHLLTSDIFGQGRVEIIFEIIYANNKCM